jgi:hypothetical protein
VTPLSWARRFGTELVPGGKHSEQLFVNRAAVDLLIAHGGRD